MKDHDHNRDPNANAARIVKEATAESTTPPSDMEETWQVWASHQLHS